MFKKKKCSKCNKKFSESFDFCPFCGSPKKLNQDFGMLGRIDEEEENFSNPFFGNFGEKMINKMIGNAMKMLEREMQKTNQKNNFPKTKVKLMINGKEIKLDNEQNKKVVSQKIKNTFSKEQLEKLKTLPKSEPKTSMKRIGSKIVYEIEMPGVSSIEDIAILKLETSIEIKAISKTKVYIKRIPINLPITGYGLNNGKFILELETKN